MNITAKQISKALNLSEAAVSMALNNKPGVSTKTRNRIVETAKALGYDFSKVSPPKKESGIISFMLYNKRGIFDTPFFSELISGVEQGFKNSGYRLMINQIHDEEDVMDQLTEIIAGGCDGIILLGTEMAPENFGPFTFLDIPIILLDSYFSSPKMDCIQINNRDGSRIATNYLIKKCKSQPGYLKSRCSIRNFDERAEGFFAALTQNGLSTSKSPIHLISAHIDSAYNDMLSIIAKGEKLAKCYFADNDEIAIGAMRAFTKSGYKIPEDISIIGFDNSPFATYVDPPLTTVNVPKSYIGKLAAERIITNIENIEFHPIKIEVSTNLIIRNSIL